MDRIYIDEESGAPKVVCECTWVVALGPRLYVYEGRIPIAAHSLLTVYENIDRKLNKMTVEQHERRADILMVSRKDPAVRLRLVSADPRGAALLSVPPPPPLGCKVEFEDEFMQSMFRLESSDYFFDEYDDPIM